MTLWRIRYSSSWAKSLSDFYMKEVQIAHAEDEPMIEYFFAKIYGPDAVSQNIASGSEFLCLMGGSEIEAAVRIDRFAEQRIAYIGGCYVLNKSQGVGTQMLAQAVALPDLKGWTYWAEVDSENQPAARMFASQGFKNCAKYKSIVSDRIHWQQMIKTDTRPDLTSIQEFLENLHGHILIDLEEL